MTVLVCCDLAELPINHSAIKSRIIACLFRDHISLGIRAFSQSIDGTVGNQPLHLVWHQANLSHGAQ